MAERAARSESTLPGRDARRRRASLPFFRRWRPAAAVVAAAVCLAAPDARAQLAPRPWLDWRTTETEHFVFHYPAAYRDWTLSLAGRIEGVRAQVQRLVAFAPTRRVHVVVDDPANEANGYAFTPLDAPTIVLWPTPPDPREEIGHARIWQELLATHEFAHVAHLTRPSRNRLRQLLWSLSPVPLGPIAVKAPRWVLEGYATYVEGRVTGTGRPNNAWRAAMLRQFALEGRMPAYGQLNGGGGWETGSFAYLAGSAYLEWLARREGDSSIVALWRRMTAVTDRSFNEAFVGVYGASPGELYGRFTAEVTAEALAIERAVRRDSAAEGLLVQRLIRNTGDPAVSPDGRYIALTTRRTDAPSQLVVWRTVDEPDTAAARRRDAAMKRDPEDVPDRAFFPPPKRPVITLVATEGAPYESPRWLADGVHLLVTRRMPAPDGTLRPDLFIWSAEDGELRRLTRRAGLRDPDPSADGHWAAAVRCDHGWCDLVRVDLESGAVRVLRPGAVDRNYYRPRVSRVTGEIIVAEQTNDRWRIARVSPDSGALRYADPDDAVSRYDATFARDGRTIITTSEAGGIANLERLGSSGEPPMRLTSVTGAAVAADVGPDGSIWFLSLHGKGYDLRRLRSDTAARSLALSLPAILIDSQSPVLPPRLTRLADDSSRRPPRSVVSDERDYGVGPSRVRYVPAATAGVGGSSAELALVRTDPVGRLGVALLGAAGSAALPEGGSLDIVWRRFRTALTASGWLSHEAPSRELAAAALEGLDLARGGGVLRADRERVGDGRWLTGTLVALAEQQHPAGFESVVRTAGIAAADMTLRQRDDETRYEERLTMMAEAGRGRDGAYVRQRAAFTFGAGSSSVGLTTLSVGYGSIGGGEGSLGERFAIGGVPSPLMDTLYDARRVNAPAYPLGSAVGSTFASYRAAVPFGPLDLFYAGVSTDDFRHPLRSFGAELVQQVPAIAALGTPAVDAVTGIARAVDEPVKGAWRYYLTLSLTP